MSDCPNVKSQDKGSDESQASSLSFDAPKRTASMIFALGVTKRNILMWSPTCYNSSLLMFIFI